MWRLYSDIIGPTRDQVLPRPPTEDRRVERGLERQERPVGEEPCGHWDTKRIEWFCRNMW